MNSATVAAAQMQDNGLGTDASSMSTFYRVTPSVDSDFQIVLTNNSANIQTINIAYQQVGVRVRGDGYKVGNDLPDQCDDTPSVPYHGHYGYYAPPPYYGAPSHHHHSSHSHGSHHGHHYRPSYSHYGYGGHHH